MLTSQRFDPNSRYRAASHRGISVAGPVNHINQGEEVPSGILNPAIMFGLFVLGDIEPIPVVIDAPIPPDEDDDDTPPVAAAVKPVRTAKPTRSKSRR